MRIWYTMLKSLFNNLNLKDYFESYYRQNSHFEIRILICFLGPNFPLIIKRTYKWKSNSNGLIRLKIKLVMNLVGLKQLKQTNCQKYCCPNRIFGQFTSKIWLYFGVIVLQKNVANNPVIGNILVILVKMGELCPRFLFQPPADSKCSLADFNLNLISSAYIDFKF